MVIEKVDLLERLYNLKDRAEADYSQAVGIKNSHLISAAMGRLNVIDRDIIAEEHRHKEAQIVQEHPVDWNSPENWAIEAHRKYLIRQLECLTGKLLNLSDETKIPKSGKEAV